MMRSLRTFALAVALSAAASISAAAATLTASPATFDATIAKAVAGDVVTLQAGAYGDLYVKKAVPVTLAFQPGATARSLNIQSTTGLAVVDPAIAFTPDAKTVSWSCALNVQNSSGVSVTGGWIKGGVAVSGVPAEATALDSTGNVIGFPTARGACIQGSAGTAFTGLEISAFHRGVVMNQAAKTTLSKLNVHDLRTSAIVGADVVDLTIDGNWLHDAKPWAWGKVLPGASATYGDHADFIALWSNAGQATPNARVRITNNRMEQTAGEAILGMWFQGSTAAPFSDFAIQGNSFKLANLQAIRLWNSGPGSIASNILSWVPAQPDGTPNDPKQAPGILLEGGVAGVTVSGNTAYAVVDNSKASNPQSATTLLLATAAVKPAPVLDPRDTQIAALTASVADLNAQLAASRAAAGAAADKATKDASALQASLDAALKARADDQAALATIRASAASRLPALPQ